MSWYRVDDKSAWHVKVVQAGNAAWGAFTRMGAVASDQLTDGFIVDGVARAIATEEEISRLLSVGLLSRIDGGFLMHDFLDWNPSAKDVARLRKERAKSGKAGAAKRWQDDGNSRGKRDGKPLAKAVANAKQTEWQNDAPFPIPFPEDPPGSPPVGDSSGAWRRDPFGLDGLAGAWVEGIRDGLNRTVTKPGGGALQSLVAAVEAHAPPEILAGAAQGERSVWVRRHAAQWAKTGPKRVNIFAWIDWLDSPELAERPSEIRAVAPLQLEPDLTQEQLEEIAVEGGKVLANLNAIPERSPTKIRGLELAAEEPGADVRWVPKKKTVDGL